MGVCLDFGVMESGAPRYRVTWNPDRLRWCFGRDIRKYPRLGDRWILETLLPWELYGAWDELAFGPKPPDGEYCHTHTFHQTREGDWSVIFNHGRESDCGFLSLDDFGADNLRLLIQCIEKGKAVQAWQVRNHTEEMLAADEKREHEQFETAYDNHMADLAEIEKLCDTSGLKTSLDPLPEPIERERRAKAVKQGKNLVH